jgi:hypothetical protein
MRSWPCAKAKLAPIAATVAAAAEVLRKLRRVKLLIMTPGFSRGYGSQTILKPTNGPSLSHQVLLGFCGSVEFQSGF